MLKSVDAAVEGGAIWINGAGNSARETWFGPFSNLDSTVDRWHNFSGNDECNMITIEAGERIVAFLRWDDSWTSPSGDLNYISSRQTQAGSLTS